MAASSLFRGSDCEQGTWQGRGRMALLTYNSESFSGRAVTDAATAWQPAPDAVDFIVGRVCDQVGQWTLLGVTRSHHRRGFPAPRYSRTGVDPARPLWERRHQER